MRPSFFYSTFLVSLLDSRINCRFQKLLRSHLGVMNRVIDRRAECISFPLILFTMTLKNTINSYSLKLSQAGKSDPNHPGSPRQPHLPLGLL